MINNIPDLFLIKNIKGLLDFVKTDYEKAEDKKRTYLYQLFEDTKYDNNSDRDFLTHAIEQMRKGVDIEPFFSKKSINKTTIYINMPQESNSGGSFLGDVGEIDRDSENGFKRQSFFEFSYNLIIISKSAIEVIIMYNILKNLLLQWTSNLEIEGFYNISVSGGDYDLDTSRMDTQYYTRTINLSGKHLHTYGVAIDYEKVDQIIDSIIIDNMTFSNLLLVEIQLITEDRKILEDNEGNILLL